MATATPMELDHKHPEKEFLKDLPVQLDAGAIRARKDELSDVVDDELRIEGEARKAAQQWRELMRPVKKRKKELREEIKNKTANMPVPCVAVMEFPTRYVEYRLGPNGSRTELPESIRALTKEELQLPMVNAIGERDSGQDTAKAGGKKGAAKKAPAGAKRTKKPAGEG